MCEKPTEKKDKPREDPSAVRPEDNPYAGTDQTYLRMQWDQEHGVADYS